MSDYGDRRDARGRLHWPGGFTRGCYYGPHPNRDGPCVLCRLRQVIRA